MKNGFRFLLLCLGCLSAAPLSAQQARNISLLGHLAFPAELNDVWGYVDPAGTEYALVGRTDGVSIVDVSQPASPQLLHHLPGPLTISRDVQSWGHYLYVSNEASGGLRIVDLSLLPAAPVYKDTVIAGMTTAHTLWIDSLGYLYLNGPDQFNGGTAILNLNPDPWRPQLTGIYDVRYVHDVYTRGDTGYFAEIFGERLTLVDLSDRSQPEIINSITYPGAFTHNTWLNDAGDVCFTTDELNNSYIIAWDISDPLNIVELDRIRSSLSALSIPHNVFVLDDYLVTAHYRDGLHLADAARPGNLVEIGYYDTHPTQGPGFNGAWSAYPYLPSGNILVSDIEEGLFILRAEYRRGCYLEGLVQDQATLAPVSQAEVRLLGAEAQDLSRDNGRFALGIADPGTYQAVFSRYGYESDTLDVTLGEGQLTEVLVSLVPQVRTPLSIQVLNADQLLPLGGVRVELSNPGVTAEYQTDGQGRIVDSLFVSNAYRMTAGQWGYRTQQRFEVIDSSNNTFTLLLEPGVYDDFVLDYGWESSGTAIRGTWERAIPQQTLFGTWVFNPGADLPDDFGAYAYVTGNNPDNGPYGDDVDRGYVWLASPVFTASAYTHPYLHFWYRFISWSLNGADPDGPGDDFLAVYLTDFVDTIEVARFDGPLDTAWQEVSIPLELYYAPQQPLKVLFYTQDLERDNQDATEAAIDGVEVKEGFPLAAEDPAGIAGAAAWFGGDRLHVRWQPEAAGQMRLRLLDAAGRPLRSWQLPAAAGSLDEALSLPAGLYVVQIAGPGGRHSALRCLRR
ncbi:MAG: choice-of-anchor B family protein [Bacteroidia bacterium]|nr:choice-of-anchor B family protein [Bacteroidia bacterium]